jgi:hypothetical protein
MSLLKSSETLLDISKGVEITQTDEGYSLRFGEGVGARNTILNKQLIIQSTAVQDSLNRLGRTLI